MFKGRNEWVMISLTSERNIRNSTHKYKIKIRKHSSKMLHHLGSIHIGRELENTLFTFYSLYIPYIEHFILATPY